MDHVDWMDEKYARELAAALARHVTPGGRVIWRSAALQPPYVPIIREAGFTVRAVARGSKGSQLIRADDGCQSEQREQRGWRLC